MSIPIADPDVGVGELSGVVTAMQEGQLADGSTVRAFEREFASYCGVEHGVATSNGTTALHVAFDAAGIGPGDRVLTTPFSFVASANAVRLCGAEPVFADVDPETFNLDPEAVERRIRAADEEIDAILAVHLYGLPAPMDELADIADRYDLALIEDAAQAHGARIGDRRVGSFGDAACFSFYPTKNMTTGEGGIVVTDDSELADRAARFVNHGRTDTYTHASVGHNFRLTSSAAAIGRAQLDRLPAFVETRRRNAATYTDRLDAVDAVDAPVEPPGTTHTYHQYTVRTEHRDALKATLSEADIDAGVYYPTPIHRQPAYDHVEVDLPVAETLAEEVLSVPVHPGLTRDDVDRVATTLEGFDP